MKELTREKATHAGNCCICGLMFYFGDMIYIGTQRKAPGSLRTFDKFLIAAHDECCMMYPEKALDIFEHDPNIGSSKS